MKSKRVGSFGEIVVEVKVTTKPWAEGLDSGAVVLASGQRGSMRGMLARFWKEELEGGRQVIIRISEKIRHTLRIEPGRPAWMILEFKTDGELREYNICVATAFDRNGAHPDNARQAIVVVAAEAKRRGIRRLGLPLLGAGDGGLELALVVQRELEAIAVHSESEDDSLEMVSLLVRDADYDAAVEAAVKFFKGATDEDKWYEAIKQMGNFRTIRVVEELQGGYSGARLEVCEVSDASGAQLPLTVFKIGPKDTILQEAEAASTARDLLGEYAVEVKGTYNLDMKLAALRMPLAAESSGEAGMSFLQFFNKSGDAREVACALSELFGEATCRIYQAGSIKWMTLSDLLEEMERTRGGRYWVEAEAGFARLISDTGSQQGRGRVSLGYPVDATFDDPFSKLAPLARAWDRRLEVSMAPRTHGDLNPRNVVMIRKPHSGRFSPRVLDFHRFGSPGPLAMDFARFEAGVHIKCLKQQIRNRSVDTARELLRYETMIVENFLIDVNSSLIGSVGPEFTKAVFAVGAIRERYDSYSLTKAKEGHRSYWMSLSLCLLSYLRPIYDRRLTDGQRSVASSMAATILDRYLVR